MLYNNMGPMDELSDFGCVIAMTCNTLEFLSVIIGCYTDSSPPSLPSFSLCQCFRSRLQRERDRDVSEKIALGMPNAGRAGDDVQYDQRLFNQSRVCTL